MQDSIEHGMFFGAKPEIFRKADELRNNMTECETLLFSRINKRKILGYRFKSQHPIDIFIVDFVLSCA